MENAQIADIFDHIADLLELKQANRYRIRSYRSAANTIRDHSKRLEDMAEAGEDLSDLPNVGDATAEKIHEVLDRGTCQRLEDLQEDVPEELTDLLAIPHLGPKKAMQLHEELEIDDLGDLRKACEKHRVRELDGFSQKTEKKILAGIEAIESRSERIGLEEASQHVESLRRRLDSIEAVRQWEVAGSFRRRKQTVGDLDFVLRADDRGAATEAILEHEAIEAVIGRGKEKVSVRLGSGLRVDFRFFEADNFGAALLYFTGSRDHTIALRRRSRARGWKLNEYGLFKGDHRLAAQSEEAVYHRLGLAWIPPELREDRGELEAATDDDLPALIEHKHLHGDLHAHTKETDGQCSIEELAEAAIEAGHDYLAITDHSKAVHVANGMDAKRLVKHTERVRQLNDERDDLELLAGVEVDILKDGALDLEEDVLADLDWVVASVHSYFDLDETAMTKRLVKAVESGVVDCIGHPLGRMLGKRAPVKVDLEEVFAACVEHEVCLEINAQPHRLDLPDYHVKAAREAGVMLVISTDAHKRTDLAFQRLGVDVARRGWLGRKDVLNTRTAKQLRDWIRKRRP